MSALHPPSNCKESTLDSPENKPPSTGQISDLVPKVSDELKDVVRFLDNFKEKNEESSKLLLDSIEKIRRMIAKGGAFEVLEKLREKNLFLLSFFIWKFVDFCRKETSDGGEKKGELTDKIYAELKELTGIEIIHLSKSSKKLCLKLTEKQSVDIYIILKLEKNDYFITDISPKEISTLKYLNKPIEKGNLFKFMVNIINEEFISLLNKNI